MALFAGSLWLESPARAVAQGRMDKENNPLKNAPHTVEDLVGEWNRPYSREAACFPAGAFRVDKYWPPVNRVDVGVSTKPIKGFTFSVWGRNLLRDRHREAIPQIFNGGEIRRF